MSDLEAFAGLVDLVSKAVGGQALLCSDDFFAGMDRLIEPKPAHFDPSTYTDRGKEMDGWESRRKRVPGNDWCILKLGVPGEIRGVDIDTSHFLGNHPPFASLDACVAAPDTDAETLRDRTTWTPILPVVPLKRGSHNLQPVQSKERWTHVRLNILPDGGVARLRVFGVPQSSFRAEIIDLAALVNGGQALACSDMFFSPMNNLILPGRSLYMGGGWETRRSRPPGSDWIIVRLAAPGSIQKITLDTGYFKGNFPDRAAVDGILWPDAPAHMLIDHPDWKEILPSSKLHADDERTFEVKGDSPVSHVRLRIFPDGGVARMRVWGTMAVPQENTGDAWLHRLNALDIPQKIEGLRRCCGAERWVQQMAHEHYASRTHLLGRADEVWWRLGDGDWREAFTHHPRIGSDISALRAKFAATATWSEGEQAGVAHADEATLQALAAGNQAYEQKFGHIFIVCATGLSAGEMLAKLQERMDNSPANELRIAAGEQAKITKLRLAKWELT